MEHFYSIDEFTSFAHRLFLGDKIVTNSIASENGWHNLAKATGPTFIMSVFSECKDTYTLLLASKTVLHAHSALFHSAQELDSFVSNLCSLLMDRSESWSSSASAAVRNILSCLLCDLYGRGLTYLSTLPGVLCTTISSAFQILSSLPTFPDSPNKQRIESTETQQITVLPASTKPSLELLCDILIRMEEESQLEQHDREYCPYVDQKNCGNDYNNVWICRGLVRQKFEAEHLRAIQLTVVDIIQRHILRVSPSIAGAVLRLFLVVLRMYFPDELSEDDDEAQEESSSDNGRCSLMHRGVCPPSFLKLVGDLSLFQKLWDLQRSYFDDGMADSAHSRTLHSILSLMIGFPGLQAVGGTPTHSSEHRYQWLSMCLLQSGVLTQRVLRLIRISTSSSQAPSYSCSSPPVNCSDDALVRICDFFTLIKSLYSLDEIRKTHGSYSLWLQSLTDVSEWLVWRYYNSSNSSSLWLSSFSNVMKVWERLACAMEFSVQQAKNNSIGSMTSQVDLAYKELHSNEQVAQGTSSVGGDLGQRLDHLLELCMQAANQAKSSHILDCLTTDSLDAYIDSLVPIVNIFCIRNKCAWWKQELWGRVISQEVAVLFSSSAAYADTGDTQAVLQRLIQQVSMQSAVVKLLLEGDNSSNATQGSNAEAICSMWFQTLSLFERIYQYPLSDSSLQYFYPDQKEMSELSYGADILPRTALIFLRLFAQWLSKDVREQQWKKNSISKLLNERLKMEDDGKLSESYPFLREDPILGLIVSLGLTVIDRCLQWTPTEDQKRKQPISSEAKMLAMLFLEELVTSQRYARVVHLLLTSNNSSRSSERYPKSLGMWLYNGLDGQRINSLYLPSVLDRHRYAKCVAQIFQFRTSKPSEGTDAIKISLTTLLLQLQVRLQEVFPATALNGEADRTFLLSDCRGVLTCCSSSESYIHFLNTIEPFAESILEFTLPPLSSLSDSSVIVGRADTLEALRLFAELTKNRERRLCLEQNSVRTILLIRFMKTVVCRLKDILFNIKMTPSSSSAEGEHSVSDETIQDWCWEATSIAFQLTLNVLKGQYCNFGVFLLYQDRALPDILKASWSILSRLTVQDCLERKSEVGEPFLQLFRELASDCFFDWFWAECNEEQLAHLMGVLDDLAFGPEALQFLRCGNDRILSSTALSECAMSVLILLSAPFQQVHSSCSQKSTWKALPALIRRSDPSLLVRLFSRCVDLLFRLTVYSSPTSLATILNSSSFQSSASSSPERINESAFMLVHGCAKLLVQVMMCNDTNRDIVLNYYIDQLTRTGTSLNLSNEKLKILLTNAFSSFHESVSSTSQRNAGSPRTNYNPAHGPPVYQFIASLNHVFHYF